MELNLNIFPFPNRIRKIDYLRKRFNIKNTKWKYDPEYIVWDLWKDGDIIMTVLPMSKISPRWDGDDEGFQTEWFCQFWYFPSIYSYNLLTDTKKIDEKFEKIKKEIENAIS